MKDNSHLYNGLFEKGMTPEEIVDECMQGEDEIPIWLYQTRLLALAVEKGVDV